MNIFVIGSGGREHTLAWKLKQSTKCDKLFVAPGNAGTSEIAENVNIGVTDFEAIANFCNENAVDMVVVGPEAPLVEGITDYFSSHPQLKQIKVIGPGKQGAMLEGSKDFSKNFMNKHGVPTAQSRTFNLATLEEGKEYLSNCQMPIVLKADGLAAGKGVIICTSISEAQATLTEMLAEQKFGEASDKVLIEQFLDGIELSVFVLTDGSNYVVLPEAKDYKRIGEGDTGPNTGGMGAVSPVSFADADFMKKVENQVIKPTITGLKNDNISYQGFIFIGLMNVNGDPFVIEYNVRMGDPETEAVIPRIKSDLLELFEATANGTLSDVTLDIEDNTTTTVVLVSEGYPGSYPKGKVISNSYSDNEAIVFHAGTKFESDQLVTSGGRVIAVTGVGSDIESALNKAYSAIDQISWEGMNYRKDIGRDLIALEKQV